MKKSPVRRTYFSSLSLRQFPWLALAIPPALAVRRILTARTGRTTFAALRGRSLLAAILLPSVLVSGFFLGTGCGKNQKTPPPALTPDQETVFTSSLLSLGRMERVAHLLNILPPATDVAGSLDDLASQDPSSQFFQTDKSPRPRSANEPLQWSASDQAESFAPADESIESAKEQKLADRLKKLGCSVKLQDDDDVKLVEMERSDSCAANTKMRRVRNRSLDDKKDVNKSDEVIEADLVFDDPDLGISNDISRLTYKGHAESIYDNSLMKVTYTKDGTFDGMAESRSYGTIRLHLTHSGTETFQNGGATGGITSVLTVQYPTFTATLKKLETPSIVGSAATLNYRYFLNDSEIPKASFDAYTQKLGLLAGDFATPPTKK